MIEHIHPDGDPTPTVRELYELKNGYAEAVTFDKDMNPTSFRLLDKGYALLGEIMRNNGMASIARGTANEEAIDAMKLRAAERKSAAPQKKGKSNGRKGTWTPS